MKTKRDKMNANLKEMIAGQQLLKEEMLAKMKDNQERMDARINANNEMFEVLEILSSPGWIYTKRGKYPL
jgi:hypothetical protein